MKKYLITGCAGFIGSNFVYYMLKKYDDILLVIDMVANGGKIGEVYNVGGHNERPNIFIVKTIIEDCWLICVKQTSMAIITLPTRADI